MAGFNEDIETPFSSDQRRAAEAANTHGETRALESQTKYARLGILLVAATFAAVGILIIAISLIEAFRGEANLGHVLVSFLGALTILAVAGVIVYTAKHTRFILPHLLKPAKHWPPGAKPKYEVIEERLMTPIVLVAVFLGAALALVGVALVALLLFRLAEIIFGPAFGFELPNPFDLFGV